MILWILHEYFIEDFTKYLNSINENIQFTREIEENHELPFLDVNTHKKGDGALKTTVYQRVSQTHTHRPVFKLGL